MRGFLNLALVVFTFMCCLISCDVVERKNVNPTITTSNNSEVEEVLKKNAIPRR
jgi:hypothetical protein